MSNARVPASRLVETLEGIARVAATSGICRLTCIWIFKPISIAKRLLAGELELIQAHLVGLIDRVFPPEVDSDRHHGDDKPWP